MKCKTLSIDITFGPLLFISIYILSDFSQISAFRKFKFGLRGWMSDPRKMPSRSRRILAMVRFSSVGMNNPVRLSRVWTCGCYELTAFRGLPLHGVCSFTIWSFCVVHGLALRCGICLHSSCMLFQSLKISLRDTGTKPFTSSCFKWLSACSVVVIMGILMKITKHCHPLTQKLFDIQ